MTDHGPQIPPAGPPGLPGRIVARVRRDVPLALLDALVVVPAYLIPLVLRFHGSVPRSNWRYFLFLLPADRDHPSLVQLPVRALRADVAVRERAGGAHASSWRARELGRRRSALVVLVGHGRPADPALGGRARAARPTIMASGAIRFQSRLFAFRRRAFDDAIGPASSLMGAGEAGAQVLSDILRHPEVGLEVVGMVDDDPRHVAQTLHGVQVLGGRAAIPRARPQARRGPGAAGDPERHRAT